MSKDGRNMAKPKAFVESIIVLESDGRTRQGKLSKLSRISTGGNLFKNQPEAVSFLIELH
jgi:hypothetical protein